MYQRRMIPLVTIVSWIALVLCLEVTIDRVEDLVFEDTDIVEQLTPAIEEADNPDEHLLLRSVRTNVAAVKLVTLAQSADSAPVSLFIQPVTASARIKSAYHHPHARSSPASCTIPLRI